jgi:transposase
MAGKKGSKPYPFEVKLKAVHLFLDEGKSQAEIVEALSLSGKHLVKEWVHFYRLEGEKGLSKRGGRPKENLASDKARIERLEMENELLKKFHTELRKVKLARCNIGSSKPTEGDTR